MAIHKISFKAALVSLLTVCLYKRERARDTETKQLLAAINLKLRYLIVINNFDTKSQFISGWKQLLIIFCR